MKRIALGALAIFIFFAAVHAHELTQVPFDWSTVLMVPPGSDRTQGNQILHFNSKNKPYPSSDEAQQFITTCLINAQRLEPDAAVLKFGSDAVTVSGAYLEMGVCTGKTINFLGGLNPATTIHGFDSFQGLPEDWIRGDILITQGTFAFKDSSLVPPVLHNVALYKGWFKDVLPVFKKEILKDTPIAFLHIDCDIYSATKTVFDELGENIVDGTVIVFDEFYNYPGCEEHEMKVLKELVDHRGLTVEYLAYNIYHEQVAVRIHKSKIAL